ncbi:MAG: DUF3472 domain-containing protein [Tannerella sp.]|jgi:hypothetical protein|nr:DUF3472 domain-containing protein [Tannerella sp.]
MRYLVVVLLSLIISGCRAENAGEALSPTAVAIPLAGNAYLTANGADGTYTYASGGRRRSSSGRDAVGQNGIVSWNDAQTVISAFFRVSHSGRLRLYAALTAESASKIKVGVAGKEFVIDVKASATVSDSLRTDSIYIGAVDVDAGHVRIDFQGLDKEGEQFPRISTVFIDGEAAAEPLVFVRNFEAYWARRGPSVHFRYTLPKEDVEYFFNELTVPEGNDVIGSYFMANGFGEGYFGIQVNSPTERRVLFSVWSPFDTQKPEDIPEDQRIKMLGKGEGVHVGEFGNEGSGGQSYLVYPWKAGSTYRFLTRVRPDGRGNTVYTSCFFAPEKGEWQLIASFLRPKTNTWYTNAYSFLENFIPEQGWITRRALYGNQWVRTVAGEWKSIGEAVFSYDATARAGVRSDYSGGVEDGAFYLRHCGFFDDSTALRTTFTTPATLRAEPKIPLDTLNSLLSNGWTFSVPYKTVNRPFQLIKNSFTLTTVRRFSVSESTHSTLFSQKEQNGYYIYELRKLLI